MKSKTQVPKNARSANEQVSKQVGHDLPRRAHSRNIRSQPRQLSISILSSKRVNKTSKPNLNHLDHSLQTSNILRALLDPDQQALTRLQLLPDPTYLARRAFPHDRHLVFHSHSTLGGGNGAQDCTDLVSVSLVASEEVGEGAETEVAGIGDARGCVLDVGAGCVGEDEAAGAGLDGVWGDLRVTAAVGQEGDDAHSALCAWGRTLGFSGLVFGFVVVLLCVLFLIFFDVVGEEIWIGTRWEAVLCNFIVL